MAIVDEIERIKTNIANAYTALEEKGATLPTERNSANLSAVIVEVPTGGGSTIEKGIIINACDDAGYATDISIVGLTRIPQYYCSSKDANSFNALNKSLVNVTLPNNLEAIESYGFYNCGNLALNSLPDSLVSIGTNAFYGNYALAIKKLPPGVTALYNYTFYYCKAITELTIEGNITLINNYVFSYCQNLRKLIMPNITSVPELRYANSFTNTPIASKTGYIYVPDSLVEEMKSATNWSTHASQIKGMSEL